MEIILGLDVSTHCVGMTIAAHEGEEIKVLEVTHLRLKVNKKIKGIKSLLIKSKLFNEKLMTFKKYHISKVIIEEPPFNPNHELNNTILKFNGILSQDIYNTLGVIPEFISSNEARKFAFPGLMAVRKFNKHGEVYSLDHIVSSIEKDELIFFGGFHYDISKKYVLFNEILNLFPNLKWAYDKNGDLANENFDALDSLVSIVGFLNKEKYKDCKPHITKWSKQTIDDKQCIEYCYGFCDKIFDKKIVLE